MTGLFRKYQNENIMDSGFLFIEEQGKTLYQVDTNYIADMLHGTFTGAVSPRKDILLKEYENVGGIWVMSAETVDTRVEASILTQVIKGQHVHNVDEEAFEKVFKKEQITDIFSSKYGVTAHPLSGVSRKPLIEIGRPEHISLYSLRDSQRN